jgi:hypothetical protein
MSVNDFSWNPMASPIPALSGRVNSIVQMSNRLYVGGQYIGLSAGNQPLNNLSYWDLDNYVWHPVSNYSNGYVNALEYNTSTTLYVGGNFTTFGNTTLNCVGLLNTTTNTWTQLVSASGTDVGFNAMVRSLHKSGNNVYVTGDFTATTSSSLNLGRVAKINASNRIEAFANATSSHVGMNGIVYTSAFISPRVFFGGSFINTVPTSNLPMQHLSYFITTPTFLLLNVTTSTSGFINTEDETTYSTITIPTRYKNITLIYNLSLNKWLLTYRSTGVTVS